MLPHSRARLCGAALVLIAGVAALSPAEAGAESREKLDADYSAKLTQLAGECEAPQLAGPALTTRQWFVPRGGARQFFFVPEPADATKPKSGASDEEKKWHAQFNQLRQKQAAALFDLAKTRLKDGDSAAAYALLHETLREDPDHAAARAALEFHKLPGGGWSSPVDQAAAKAIRKPHPRFGWTSYRRLETDHYSIVSNAQPKDILLLAQHLENLHSVWRQAFFAYWSSAAALEQRLAGGQQPLLGKVKKLDIVFFATRQEYVAQLTAAEPKIGLTTGIYLDKEQAAYFFAGDESAIPTWYHEATHQLFQELDRLPENPGGDQNFWIVEGLALYMESLARHPRAGGSCWTLGGWDADRLQFARYRALSGDFLLPLGKLVTFSRTSLQDDAEIRKLYGQAAGMAHFLIDGRQGKYRAGTIAYARAIYERRDTPESLAKFVGVPLAQLDTEYRDFLQVTDEDLARLIAPPRLRNLSLGKTAVTDVGLKHLTGAVSLQWLDLAGTKISDEGLAAIQGCTQLKQLFLEGANLTDASLEMIGGLKELEELDLSALPRITDAGLAAIGRLKKLKTLYLSGSPISDVGLVHLKNLKQLEMLETTGAQVTTAGLKQLKSSLPKLKQSKP